MTIYLATGNAHKREETQALFALHDLPATLELASTLGGMPEVIEDGDTFAANAEKKATALAAMAPPGSYVLADDSGLCVDALNGAPGLFSARYAGPDGDAEANNAKLLTTLAAVPEGQRGAAFVCVLALLEVSSGRINFFQGRCLGRIVTQPTGDAGFGYDPLFIATGEARTFAAMSAVEKHALSHRGNAVAALAAHFRSTSAPETAP